MALKNLEETILDRIQRALAKELKRLRGRSGSTGNGRARSHVPSPRAEAMAAAHGAWPGDATPVCAID